MSGIFRKRRGGTPPESSSSKKQRFVDATKALLDIAKESSDAFPPLKSCLGFISALIKHYDESNDVKDKLDDLIPWLEKMLATLTKGNPSKDLEEVERRSQLAKSLEDVGTRAASLSDKGNFARVLDKARDSAEVVALVEKLRRASVIYQMTQQQSIQDQVSQLTAHFGLRLKLNHTSPAQKKIASVCARLNRLEVEESPVKNESESKRRMRLFETLEDIKEKLQNLSKRSTTGGATEGEANMSDVCDLADHLRDVLVEYQFSQQKAIFEQNCRLIDAVDLSVLNGCTRAKGAEFRHGTRSSCLKGTRTAVLDDIELWSRDYKASPVYWLNGVAGTGKSTIAQTIAERVFADGRLGASFFCSRDFQDRRNLLYIFPTLAFQLAQKYPEFRSILVPLLRSNPDIAHELPLSQMESLIVGPLSSSAISTVIIIDALDECVDEDPQSAILSVMGRLVEDIPNVKFFITGRPEPRIQSGFRLGLLRPLTDVFVLHEVDPSVVNMDIRLFLEHGLQELAERHGVEQDGWPTEENIDLLCKRAAGLFVYAVATVKFLDHSFMAPSDQLDIIMKSPGSTAHEGQANLQLGATLDSLYISALQAAFSRAPAGDDEKVRSVIGAVVLAVDPLSPSAIADLVNMGKHQVMKILQLIRSLLKLTENLDSPVLPFHKSFPDFIINSLRCSNERFYISPSTGHLNLALSCLELMNHSLGQNLLSLPDYSLNSEVKDLEARISKHISLSLRYACKSWHSHLIEVKEDIPAIIPALENFLQVGFLAWLEVLSVIGGARGAVLALEKLIPWLQEVTDDYHLLHTARDYFQFATTFLELISISAAHIYHSALELSPLSSLVRKFYYHKRPCPSPRVVIGTPESWKPTTAGSTKSFNYLSSAWSPCGQFIAIVAERAVEIWDALTLKLLSTMQSPTVATRFKRGVTYSPDGRSLAGCSHDAIIIWDTQTGGMAKEVKFRDPHNGLDIMWSLDGRTIGRISRGSYNVAAGHTYNFTLYNVISGATLSSEKLQSEVTPQFWACNKYFQVTTITRDQKSHTLEIFEAGITVTRIKSFPLKSHSPVGYSSFGPFSLTTHRLSVLISQSHNHDPELLIMDITTSEVLLQAKGSYHDICYSPDGNLLAATTKAYLSIWRYTPGRYVQWKEIPQQPINLQFSPTLSSIFGYAGALLCSLHLDYPPTSSTAKSLITTHSRPLDAFSPHDTFIVTTYHNKSTLAVTSLKSPNPFPSQFIDTDLEISEIVLTGNVLLVKSSETIVGWLLTKDGEVDGILGNSRADQNDSLWKVSPQDLNPAFLARLEGRENHLEFAVKDDIAAIKYSGVILHAYHTGTGEIIRRDNLPSVRPWYRFKNPLNRDDCNIYHRKQKETPECSWPVSQNSLQEGWIKDPEGRHRLWLHPHWRAVGNEVDWLDKVTTLRLRNSSELVVIKF